MTKNSNRRPSAKAHKGDIKSNSVHNGLPGFERWDDVLQVSFPTADQATMTAPPNHPRWILVYGWGDALPKHINKYCEKYRELFPQATQVLVTCGISKAGYEPRIERRAQMVARLVAEVFGKGDVDDESLNNGNILVHLQETHATHPTGHGSTPGGTDYTLRNIMLWGGAAALKISRNTKVPFVLSNIYGSLLFVPARLRSYKARQDPPGAFSRKAMNSIDHIDPARTRLLYLYGKDDKLIYASDIESHIAESRERGWEVDVERFDGSQHVGHMRKYPERYWDAICDSWNQAISQQPQQ